MATTIKIAVSIRKTLFDQAEALAQQIHISRPHLFEMALETFIQNYPVQVLPDEVVLAGEDQLDPEANAESPNQDEKTAATISRGRMPVNRGDVYWVPLAEPGGLDPGYTHPHVVIQEDVLNRTRINTVVVCALTSNLKRAGARGNVLLEAGEANLPRQSVVVVSQVSTVDRTQLGEYIGSLHEPRIRQILAGMQFLQALMEHRESGEKSQGGT